MTSGPGFNGDLGTVMYTVLVDIRPELHVPGWCLQRHDNEGNSWKRLRGPMCAFGPDGGVCRLAAAWLAGSGIGCLHSGHMAKVISY